MAKVFGCYPQKMCQVVLLEWAVDCLEDNQLVFQGTKQKNKFLEIVPDIVVADIQSF